MLPYQIVFEDDCLLIANKNAGISSLPEKQDNKSLLELLGESQKILPVNRIDKPVSGLVIFAKDSKTQNELNEQIRNNNLGKYYKAIVANKPENEAGSLSHYLQKNSKLQKSYVVEPTAKDAKQADLNYKVLQSSERYHLLEIELITGRFHQIRAQFAAIASAIVGDLKYGAKRSSPNGSIFLHCYKLVFFHPQTKQSTTIEIQNPEIWAKYGF